MENDAKESQALSSHLKTLLGNVGKPPVKSPATFRTMELPSGGGEAEEDEGPGGKGGGLAQATMEYFHNNRLPLADDFGTSASLNHSHTGPGSGPCTIASTSNDDIKHEKRLNFDPKLVIMLYLEFCHPAFIFPCSPTFTHHLRSSLVVLLLLFR